MLAFRMQLEFETDIAASPQSVFDLLADLRGYDRWLPRSQAFHGTTAISDGPIGVGTTYAEPGPTGVRRGRITACERPTRLAFEQPMTLKPRGAGVIEIHVAVTLTPAGESVHLRRTVDLSCSGPARLAQALIRRMFVRENERMLRALKTCAEGGVAA
jgi:uncharacterized protein YndB with AHSA1/START domain